MTRCKLNSVKWLWQNGDCRIIWFQQKCSKVLDVKFDEKYCRCFPEKPTFKWPVKRLSHSKPTSACGNSPLYWEKARFGGMWMRELESPRCVQKRTLQSRHKNKFQYLRDVGSRHHLGASLPRDTPLAAQWRLWRKRSWRSWATAASTPQTCYRTWRHCKKLQLVNTSQAARTDSNSLFIEDSRD